MKRAAFLALVFFIACGDSSGPVDRAEARFAGDLATLTFVSYLIITCE